MRIRVLAWMTAAVAVVDHDDDDDDDAGTSLYRILKGRSQTDDRYADG